MDWSQALPDEVDVGFDHFSGLQSAAQAVLCSLIQAADINQTWMGDGARNLSEWVSVRLRTRIETARFLVSVARRLVDLPVLSERFSSGILSLDQVDAISRMATPDTEAGLIDDAVGLSNAALDRAARKAHPPSTGHERTGWERRALWLQWNLDQSELKLGGRLPAVGSRPHRSGKSDPVMRVPPSLRPRTPMAHHRAPPRPSHPPTPRLDSPPQTERTTRTQAGRPSAPTTSRTTTLGVGHSPTTPSTNSRHSTIDPNPTGEKTRRRSALHPCPSWQPGRSE